MGKKDKRYAISFRYDLSNPKNRPDWRVCLQKIRFYYTVQINGRPRIEIVVLKLSCDVGGLPDQFWLTGDMRGEGKDKVNRDEKGVITDVRITAKEPCVGVDLDAKWFRVEKRCELSMNSLIAVLIDRIDYYNRTDDFRCDQFGEAADSLVVDEAEGSRVFHKMFQSRPFVPSYHIVIQYDLLPGNELRDWRVHIWSAKTSVVRLRKIIWFKHKSLVLKVQFPERNPNPACGWLSGDCFWITGELNRDEEGGVINVCITPHEPKHVMAEFDMPMDDPGNPSAFSMGWVIDHLLDHPSFYDVRKENCYEYAYAIVRKLGSDFAKQCSSKKARDRVLESIKLLRRPEHLKNVLRKGDVAGGVLGTAAAVGVLAVVAASCPPLALAAVFLAPEATLVTTCVFLTVPTFGVTISTLVKFCKVVKGAVVQTT